jgi:hypothetical protein
MKGMVLLSCCYHLVSEQEDLSTKTQIRLAKEDAPDLKSGQIANNSIADFPMSNYVSSSGIVLGRGGRLLACYGTFFSLPSFIPLLPLPFLPLKKAMQNRRGTFFYVKLHFLPWPPSWPYCVFLLSPSHPSSPSPSPSPSPALSLSLSSPPLPLPHFSFVVAPDKWPTTPAQFHRQEATHGYRAAFQVLLLKHYQLFSFSPSLSSLFSSSSFPLPLLLPPLNLLPLCFFSFPPFPFFLSLFFSLSKKKQEFCENNDTAVGHIGETSSKTFSSYAKHCITSKLKQPLLDILTEEYLFLFLFFVVLFKKIKKRHGEFWKVGKGTDDVMFFYKIPDIWRLFGQNMNPHYKHYQSFGVCVLFLGQ